MEQNVYLVLNSSAIIETKGESANIKLSALGDVYCSDKKLNNELKSLSCGVIRTAERRRVLGVVEIIRLIESCAEGQGKKVSINAAGEPEVLVEVTGVKKTNVLADTAKAVAMSLFTAVGSLYVIMAYNNDVGAAEVFRRLYEILGISYISGYRVAEISYGVGMALGLIIFYNHLGNARLSDTPTPIQVEMDKYTKDEVDTLISKLRRGGDNDARSL